MSIKVVVADNLHYMDESENYEIGTFASLQLAIDVSKRIVDKYLASAYEPGMTSSDLYQSYVRFGEDLYIIASAVEQLCRKAVAQESYSNPLIYQLF